MLQDGYRTASEEWVDEPTGRLTTDTLTQQHTVLLWTVAQLLITALVVGVVIEPVIRRLQQERSDGTSHFPYASEGIRQVYGVSPEPVRDDAAAMLAALHPDDVTRVPAAIATSAAQLTPWRDEYRVCMPDGREYWVLGNATRERESDGSVLWHGFITDVTERRSAIQAIADARTLLQNVLDADTEAAIIATDVNGLITVFNSGAERMLQYRAGEMIGRFNPMILHLKGEVITSHEIRTPMNGVLGFANLLRDTLRRSLSPAPAQRPKIPAEPPATDPQGSASSPLIRVLVVEDNAVSVLQEDRDRCVSAGMDDIIGKPVQPAELTRLLRHFAHRDLAGATA